MSMSTHVTGFAPPDETWQKMKAVWDSCLTARIPVPDPVLEFFGGEQPDPSGVKISLPLREWHDEGGAGYELDVSAIPEQVQVLRFYNSW
jgi:hypothetical protein